MINEETIENQETQPIEQPEEELFQEEQPVEQPQQPDPVVQKNNDFDENIKQLRESKKREQERADRAEYERDQMMRYVQSLNNTQVQQQPQEQQQLQGFKLNEDDFVEPEHVNHLNSTVQNLRQEVNDWKLRNEETTADLKLHSEFKDFDDVVTGSNVKSLLKKYPEMQEIVSGQAPLYTRGKATYRLIKQFLNEQAAQAVQENNQKTIHENFNKPRPAVSAPSTTSDTQLNYANLFANGYTEDVSKFLRKQMDDAIERYNNQN